MKDDTISRAAALTALNGCTEIYLNNLPPTIYKEDAIKAVKAQPSATDTNVGGNLIDRQAAIETVKKHYRVDNDLLEVIAYEIEALPPAQPGWIPTSVRLPEDNEEVLFCDNEGERWLGWHYGFWKTERLDFNEDEVVAWMPLLTPYREGGQDGV